jgi:hypothetical protein
LKASLKAARAEFAIVLQLPGPKQVKESIEMEFNDKDPVWQLLKKSEPRKASGAFAQNVSRAVRQLGDESQSEKSSWLAIFFSKPVLATGAAFAIAIGMFFAFSGDPATDQSPGGAAIAEVSPNPPSEISLPTVAEQIAEEFEVVTYVDEFLAVGDPSELNDEALAELLFSL